MSSSRKSKADPRQVMKDKVKKFYNLNRDVTDDELDAEIGMIMRKQEAGSMCDRVEQLAAILGI